MSSSAAWKAKKIAAGFCRHCCRNTPGGPDGTATLCGPCNKVHKKRNENYRRRMGILPRGQSRFNKVDQMMALLDKLKYRQGASL